MTLRRPLSGRSPQGAEALAGEHPEGGRNSVLVVDEAHLLDNQQLEAIRLLSNHDMDAGSPFAVVLFGQPTLRQRLRLGVLAALDQRIAVRLHIAGMDAADTADYIRHHCTFAGRADTLFSEDAIALIHNASRGHPARSTTWPYTRSPPPTPPTTPSSTRKPHRHRRNRLGLNKTRIDSTTTPSIRRGPRHHAHHGPAHHTERGRPHAWIVVTTDDAVIIILGDAQHTHRVGWGVDRKQAAMSIRVSGNRRTNA